MTPPKKRTKKGTRAAEAEAVADPASSSESVAEVAADPVPDSTIPPDPAGPLDPPVEELFAAGAPELDDAPGSLPPTLITCSRCDRPRTYETDGVQATPVAYCNRHRPANITMEMVAAFQATL